MTACPNCGASLIVRVAADMRLKTLSKREAELKRVLARFLAADGCGPRVRDLAAAMDMPNRSSQVTQLLHALERKGHLERKGRRWTLISEGGLHAIAA